MSYLLTPTSITIVESVFKDPLTGKIIPPILTFDPIIVNPYYGEIDPLNEDPLYHEKVINYFYTKLTEKWLFKSVDFKKLLKYFRVEKSDDKGTVSLIANLDKIPEQKLTESDRKYIFRYIEKYFVSRKFVENVLRQYVARTKTKWYDLFNNTDILKELFAHKLKKLIVNTIYEFQE